MAIVYWGIAIGISRLGKNRALIILINRFEVTMRDCAID
jgi:hypothetical protein